jgi:hypothetical protein
VRWKLAIKFDYARIQRKQVVDYFNVFSQLSAGEAAKNHE